MGKNKFDIANPSARMENVYLVAPDNDEKLSYPILLPGDLVKTPLWISYIVFDSEEHAELGLAENRGLREIDIPDEETDRRAGSGNISGIAIIPDRDINSLMTTVVRRHWGYRLGDSIRISPPAPTFLVLEIGKKNPRMMRVLFGETLMGWIIQATWQRNKVLSKANGGSFAR